MGAAAEPEAKAFDPARRYVRLVNERADGFIEFNFAIGAPDVFVELIMRRPAFEEFCRDNRVEMLTASSDGGEASAEWNWTLADARETRFR